MSRLLSDLPLITLRICFLCPTLRLLQASATVSAIWANNSSIQLNVLNQICPPALFPSLQPELYTAQNGEAFVNDTTLWDTSYTASLHYVTAQMAAKAQAWEWFVHAVGGYLNLLKTFYFASNQLEVPQEWSTCNENYYQ
jgi:hypothetical protein